MRLSQFLFCAFICCFSLIEAKLTVTFLGVIADDEPLLKERLVTQVGRELKALKELAPVSKAEVDFLYQTGVLKTPEITIARASELMKKLNSRIISFGVLKKMEIGYKRSWLRPWRGTVTYNHGIWLEVIDGLENKMKYSGLVSVFHEDKNVYFGVGRRIGHIDPMIRHKHFQILIDELTAKTVYMIYASTKGLVDQIVLEPNAGFQDAPPGQQPPMSLQDSLYPGFPPDQINYYDQGLPPGQIPMDQQQYYPPDQGAVPPGQLPTDQFYPPAQGLPPGQIPMDQQQYYPPDQGAVPPGQLPMNQFYPPGLPPQGQLPMNQQYQPYQGALPYEQAPMEPPAATENQAPSQENDNEDPGEVELDSFF